jgi:hypothetical protein
MTTLAELAEAVKEIESLAADTRPSILSMFDSVFRPEPVVDSEEKK